MMTRPDPSEYNPYYSKYIALVPAGDILDVLQQSGRETAGLLRDLPDDRAGYRYAPGKWTVRQVLSHVTDTERAFTFRAFWFARGGPGELGSVDPDPFVAQAFAEERGIENLVDEFEALRADTVALFRSLPPDTWTRTGRAAGNTFSVRAFPYLIAGHEMHHRSLLRERYGLGG